MYSCGYRQGMHQVTFRAQHGLGKALDNGNAGHDHYSDDQRGIDKDGDPCQRAGKIVEIKRTQQRGNAQQRDIQGNQFPERRPELVFQQFDQHRNTSRNNASTLLPFSSRM